MGLITAGLGFLKGTAGAVEQLSDEKRKALAEKLRMDALEQMDIRAEKRRQKFTTSEREAVQVYGAGESEKQRGFLAGESDLERESRESISEAGITSREDISANRLALDETISKNLETWRGKTLEKQQSANEAAVRKNKLKAWEEVQKITKDIGLTSDNIDQVNGVLQAGDVGQHFTSETIPGKKGGLLGRGGRPESTTYKLVSDDPGKAPDQALDEAGLEDGASLNLKGLLDEATAMGDSKQTPVKVPGISDEDKGQDPRGESMTQTGPPDLGADTGGPQGKGFLQVPGAGVTRDQKKEPSALAEKYKGWTITVDNDGTIRLVAPDGTRTYMKKPSKERKIRAQAEKTIPGRRGKPTMVTAHNPKYDEYMELLAFAQGQ